MISNANPVCPIQSPKTPNVALPLQFIDLQRKVLEVFQEKDLQKHHHTLTSNRHTRKGALMAILNHPDLQRHSIALFVRECADSIAFDELPKYTLLSAESFWESVHVGQWAGAFVHLSSDSSDVVLKTPLLLLETFEKISVVAKITFHILIYDYST